MLTCLEMTRLVTDYVERRLSRRDRLRFQVHLGLCRHCRRYVRQMRLAAATLGRMPPGPVPEPTMDELLKQFRGWKGT